MAGSWTVVGSQKHAEKMLIQLRSPTAPSWPAVQCRAGLSGTTLIDKVMFSNGHTYLVMVIHGHTLDTDTPL